jgi:GntR family transcriptional regulator / MocR family aminotransferase
MLLNLRGSGSLHRRLGHALKSAIRSGRLAPGARVPSTRTLAGDLGVSRNTVMLAYEQLVAEGYLVSRDRATTSVAAGTLPAAVSSRPGLAARPRLSTYGRRLTKDPAMPPSTTYASRPGIRYDFRYGRPCLQQFPHEVWRRLLAARARRTSIDGFGYGPPAGYAPLRAALAEYLGRARGVVCDAEQIVIVNGSQQGLDLAARVLLDPGDRVVMEEPHYAGARLVFEAAGARLTGVPVDAGGLDPARLPSPAARVRLACVTPCHQFPTGVIMPAGRRQALLSWASRAGAWVLEDDYVSEFRYEGRPLEALQALDREGRVIYLGTFSKTLFPALRLAYLVLPRALVRPFVAAKWMTDRYTAMLGQEALTDFITSGHFERYLRRARAANAARRRVLIAALRARLGDRVEIAGDNAGVHLLVWLNDVRPDALDAVIAAAARAGVGVYPITSCFFNPPRRAGLLFGYASLTEAEIRAGIERFAGALSSARSRRAAVFPRQPAKMASGISAETT